MNTIQNINTKTLVMWKYDRQVTINYMCLFATSPHVVSVRRWQKHACQIFCSLPTHLPVWPCTLAQRFDQHICLPTWPDRKLTSRPNSWFGGGAAKHKKTAEYRIAKHFLNYVVTSLKFRLPTWRLHTTESYDSKTHQTPTDTEWLL